MPVNPKSLQNLNKKGRFVKGQSGNPKGRPKKLPDLNKLLIEILADEKDGRSALEAMLMAMRNKAIKGDTKAFETLIDRAYGKLTLKIDGKIDTQPVFVVNAVVHNELAKLGEPAKELPQSTDQ